MWSSLARAWRSWCSCRQVMRTTRQPAAWSLRSRARSFSKGVAGGVGVVAVELDYEASFAPREVDLPSFDDGVDVAGWKFRLGQEGDEVVLEVAAGDDRFEVGQEAPECRGTRLAWVTIEQFRQGDAPPSRRTSASLRARCSACRSTTPARSINVLESVVTLIQQRSWSRHREQRHSEGRGSAGCGAFVPWSLRPSSEPWGGPATAPRLNDGSTRRPALRTTPPRSTMPPS